MKKANIVKNTDLTITQLVLKIKRYKKMSHCPAVQQRLEFLQNKLKSTSVRQRCNALLITLMGKDQADSWWSSRNSAFNMLNGNQQWEIDPESVYSYLLSFYIR
jgi:hypothetical protein